jgi:hypothetical protein
MDIKIDVDPSILKYIWDLTNSLACLFIKMNKRFVGLMIKTMNNSAMIIFTKLSISI